MKISKTHQSFADRLNNQRALNHPEEFLGPNWKEVLNFWLYIDTLSPEQLGIVSGSYLALELTDKVYGENLIWNAACGVISEHIFNCVYVSAPCLTTGVATRELIGAHKILEQGKELKIVQLFLDSFKTDP